MSCLASISCSTAQHPFWGGKQIQLKSFKASATAIFDKYIIFICTNDAKERHNNYKYRFYTQLLPFTHESYICVKILHTKIKFHLIKIGLDQKIMRCIPCEVVQS